MDEASDEAALRGFPISDMRRNLLQWWRYAKRHYPWRETRDPYRVLVAEVLLHRTRADQVVPLYEMFVKHFGDIRTLARSSPDDLGEMFRSAGLHWRWSLLHGTATQLDEDFGGEIPEDLDLLTSLPGVSHYIASAVRCFAFGKPDAVLDTNTVRVTGRLLGLTVTDSSRRSTRFRRIIERLVDSEHPREFNLALIDLAAKICKSRSPLHQECRLSSCCRCSMAPASSQQTNVPTGLRSEDER